MKNSLKIIGIIISIFLIVLAFLEIFAIYECFNYIEILTGILLFIQGYEWLKKDKISGILNFVAGSIILICGIIMMFL